MMIDVLQRFKRQNSYNIKAIEVLEMIEKLPMSSEKLALDKYIKTTILNDDDIDPDVMSTKILDLRQKYSINNKEYAFIDTIYDRFNA